MDKITVKQFAQLIGTKIEGVSSAGWLQARCPLAPWTHDSGKDSSPSFAIESKPGKRSRFYCFACEGGDLYTLLQRLKELGAQLPKYKLGEAMKLVVAEDDEDVVQSIREYGERPPKEDDDGNNDAIFSEKQLAQWGPAWANLEARAALVQKRQMGEAVATALDLRYNHKLHGVTFPIRDFDGRLCGLRTRRLTPGDDEPSYHMHKNYEGHYNRLVWYGEDTVDFSKPVLMVESVFDRAAVWPIYRNVVAPLTVGMGEPKIRRMTDAYDLVTLFDKGKGGDKARKLIDKHLPDSVRLHLQPRGTHFAHDDREAKDPDEMRRDELQALLAEHLPLEKPQ